MTDRDAIEKHAKEICEQLAKSKEGMDAIFYLHAWLSDTGDTIDIRDQARILHLLQMAWGSRGYLVKREFVSTLQGNTPFLEELGARVEIMATAILDRSKGQDSQN